MPIHTSSPTRREMLAGSLGAAGAVVLNRFAVARERADTHAFALLADTHIPSDAKTEARGVNMADHLRKVVAELMATEPRPAGAMINGDCAYLKGQDKDYQLLSQLVQPLVDAEFPLHMTMGNHDDREQFYQVLKSQQKRPPVQAKHVSVIETPPVHFLLIDTLLEVNQVTGEVGEAQLRWLEQAIEACRDQPVVVVGHHNPQFGSPERVTGIKDSEPLFRILDQHRNVKAYVFGHTHNWNVSQRTSGLYLVNLPPVAYVFHESRPSGWVLAQADRQGMKLQLRSLDPRHPQHQQMRELKWR